MNEYIREAVREKMKHDKLTQKAFAEQLDMPRPNLVRLITGNAGQIPRRWQEVLDALELELIAVPKSEAYRSDVILKNYLSGLPRRYSDMTPEKRAEVDKGVPAEVLDIRRRWDAGELKNGLETVNGNIISRAVIEHSLKRLDDTYSRSYRKHAIQELKQYAAEEVKPQTSEQP